MKVAIIERLVDGELVGALRRVPATRALDVAASHTIDDANVHAEHSLRTTAEALGVTREGARLAINSALQRMRRAIVGDRAA